MKQQQTGKIPATHQSPTWTPKITITRRRRRRRRTSSSPLSASRCRAPSSTTSRPQSSKPVCVSFDISVLCSNPLQPWVCQCSNGLRMIWCFSSIWACLMHRNMSKWYEIGFVGCVIELAFQRALVCAIWRSIEGVMAHFMIGYIR